MLENNFVVEIDEFGFNWTYHSEHTDNFIKSEKPRHNKLDEIALINDVKIEFDAHKKIDLEKKEVQKVESLLNELIYESKHFKQCPFCKQSIPGYYLRVHDDKCDASDDIIKCPECSMTIKPVSLVVHKLRSDSNLAMNYINTFSLDEDTSLEQVVWRFKGKRSKRGKDKKSLCYICGKFVEHRKHMKIHETRTEKCKLCGQLIKEWRMKIHMMNIHQKTNYVCDICGKVMTTKYRAHHHKMLHQEKRHKCEFCDKAFHLPDGLRDHLRVHTGEQPFQCDHCGKKFTLRGNLRKHLRQHTDERPHKCSYCDSSFRHKVSLKGHIVSNHPGKELPNNGNVYYGAGRPKRAKDDVKKCKTKQRDKKSQVKK